MKGKTLLNLIFLLTLKIGFISCAQKTKSNNQTIESNEKADTIIVKHKNELNQSFEVGFYSKSFSYYWLVGKDTLDFVLNATEYVKDSTLHLSVHHKHPILFTTTLTKIDDCFALIKEDFYLTKLNSFYFKEPIFYLDLGKELSTDYEKQFGRKIISYEKLNQFFLNSELNKQLEKIVNPIDKKIKGYSIEKFHLTEKKHLGYYLPNVDLTEYPEFTINGMGLYVQIEDKKTR